MPTKDDDTHCSAYIAKYSFGEREEYHLVVPIAGCLYAVCQKQGISDFPVPADQNFLIRQLTCAVCYSFLGPNFRGAAEEFSPRHWVEMLTRAEKSREAKVPRIGLLWESYTRTLFRAGLIQTTRVGDDGH